MKKIFFSAIAAATLALGLTGCADELNIKSINPQSSQSVGDMELLAKCYAQLGLTGQQGGAGKGDLSDDEGESGFYRTTFNLQELPTDECMWAWQTDTDIPQITMMNWNSSSIRVQWAYTRLTYGINLYNSYLSQVADNEANRLYRAEVRFLRALHYWYLLDLFGKAPFKTDFDISMLPIEYSGKEMYEWLDKELTEIEPLMAEMGAFNNTSDFGRADRGAAYMLHARLALNSLVYTKDEINDLDKAIRYCDLLLAPGSPYALSTTEKNGNSGYAQLFMADNDRNADAMKEIIFPIRQDGTYTRCYSGSIILIAGARSGAMPDYGMRESWTCYFSRAAMTQKFISDLSSVPLASEESTDPATIAAQDEADGTTMKHIIALAGDDRAMLYAGCANGVRKVQTDAITSFTDGLSLVKWTNLNSDNTAGTNVSWPDTDIPLFRLAEAYMTRAEAKFRKDDPTAYEDVNVLRRRANAREYGSTELSEDILIDEWCREFFFEGRRRSDLVRFGRFAGGAYIWDWKGGVAAGTTVDSHFNVYPIPADDIRNNSDNLSQNPGY